MVSGLVLVVSDLFLVMIRLFSMVTCQLFVTLTFMMIGLFSVVIT